jgi:L-ascorbate metabolism protein UlaG (beta-lactamase superfamily)
LAINPVSKDSKFKASRFGADMVLISANHPDFNGIEAVTFGDKKPFVIAGPGEYELRGVVVRGFPAETKYGDNGKLNTIYLVSMEGMNLCFLGALGEKELPKNVLEAIDDIDVLFVPIGGDGVLTPAQGYELSVSLEPHIVIPAHFGSVGVKGALATFLKEGGEQGQEEIEKLTLKKKDLEGKEGDIVVLSPAH